MLITGVHATPEIVLKSMPGTDNVNRLFGELQTLTGLIICQNLLNLSQDFSLANRSPPMGTLILVGMKVPTDSKNPDFQFSLDNDLAIVLREIRLFPHK
jgi:hypothetical protein